MIEHGKGYDPHAPTIPARSRRTRWLLLAATVLAASLPVIELHNSSDPGTWLPEVTPAIFPSIMAMAMSPFGRTTRSLPLDEFERDTLARAGMHAQLVIVIGLAALFVWLTFAAKFEWLMPTQPRHWMALGIAVVGIAASLPVLFAEWMVPLPPSDD